MIDSKNKPKTDLAGILNQYRDFVKQELFPIDLKVVQGPFKSYLPQLMP